MFVLFLNPNHVQSKLSWGHRAQGCGGNFANLANFPCFQKSYPMYMFVDPSRLKLFKRFPNNFKKSYFCRTIIFITRVLHVTGCNKFVTSSFVRRESAKILPVYLWNTVGKTELSSHHLYLGASISYLCYILSHSTSGRKHFCVC